MGRKEKVSELVGEILFTAVLEIGLWLQTAIHRERTPSLYRFPDDIVHIHGPMVEDAVRSVETGPILDLGCGSSTAVPYLAREGVGVYRVDKDQEAMEAGHYFIEFSLRVRDRSNHECHNEDADDLPFEDGEFELVVLSASLDMEGDEERDMEYIDYANSDIERVLAEGGDLVITSSQIQEHDIEEFLKLSGVNRAKFDSLESSEQVIWLKDFAG